MASDSANDTPELPIFATGNGIGFHSLAGDKKLKLLPSPYSEDALPPSSASLLSVSSNRRLLAAAGPKLLVITSTDGVREAYKSDADDDGVITSFRPELTLPSPQLRHISFSVDGSFLVTSPEDGGGLVVYSTDALLRRRNTVFDLSPTNISTDGVAVRALIPNPDRESTNMFAVILDSGRLLIANIQTNEVLTLSESGVTCAGWSNKGKAVIVGLKDGTAAQYRSNGILMATLPRPPKVPESYTVAAIYWLYQDEFFIIHSPTDAGDDMPETMYHIVRADKARTKFTFHTAPYELFYPSMAPERDSPPRFSLNRLRDWNPGLDDLLILNASHSCDFAIMFKSSAPIAKLQEVMGEFNVLNISEDQRTPQLPAVVNDGDTRDGLLIGETLDLSSTEKIAGAIPRSDEVFMTATPLPALLALNDEGVLSSWYIVFDNSLKAKTAYPGLVADSDATPKESASDVPQSAQKTSVGGFGTTGTTSSVFGTPSATSATPPTSIFGQTGFPSQNGSANTSAFNNNKPASGAAPAFGAPSKIGFGAPSNIGFGAPSKIGFGAPQTLGNRSSPWGQPSQTSTSQTSTSQTSTSQTSTSQTSSAFSGAAGASSGFAKLGGANSSPAGSGFSSFASGSTGKSSFSNLPQQISAFGGNNQSPGSFGSTATLTSPESSSFAPAKQSNANNNGDTERSKRDEATPTPQNPFGLGANGFKLTSSFGQNASKKEEPSSSFASTGFSFDSVSSALNDRSPLTPKNEPKTNDFSTTPAFPPKSNTPLFQSTTPKPSLNQKPPPPTLKGEDAPLPPDFTIQKAPSNSNDDDLPPLAGSPAIKIEAPESDVPSSPLDSGEGDLSVEEHDGDDEEEDQEEDQEEETDPSPSDAARRGRPTKQTLFPDSVNQSPQIPPAAPTPPTQKSGPSSRSGDEARVRSQGSVFNQPHFQSKPMPNALFPNAGPPPTGASFSKPPALFSHSQQQQPPQRSPLPEPVRPPPKPATPQPEVADLSDDEDERIRVALAAELRPTRELAEFIAHSDYTGSVSKTGTAAQIEMLYRDMNSMVDTVGLNSRAVASFIAYHTNRSEKHRSHLDRVVKEAEHGTWYEDWTLNDLEELKVLEDELEQELNSGRVQDGIDTIGQIGRLHHENAKLLTKLNDIRRQTIMRKDPKKAEAVRKAPLSKELSEQQKAIRFDYAKLLSLLGQAEEEAYLLKSKVASHNNANGKPSAVPTVDAVKKTITRLIQMTQNKNNDILMLEQQLRKLDIEAHQAASSSLGVFGTPGRTSRGLRDGRSPIATPPTNRSRMSLSELNRSVRTPEPDETPSKGYGLFYTPEGSPSRGDSRSLISLADMDEQTIAKLTANAKKRTKVAETLAKLIQERGVKVTRFA